MKARYVTGLLMLQFLCFCGRPDVEDEALDTYQVTHPYMQKFVEEVTYPDRDFSYTKVTDYPGGGPGEADIPPSVNLEWAPDISAGPLRLKIWEKSWSREYSLQQGASSQELVNLVPGVRYSYEVSGQNDKNIIARGRFLTEGSVHQVYFTPDVRNARDLGGWKTLDGKTVAFRKLYRGGRLDGDYIDDAGRAEFRAAGIKAELDLREASEVPQSSPVGPDIAFFAPGFPEGYEGMLRIHSKGIRQSFEFIADCLRKDKPVYIHCAAGRDRTGTIALLLLGLLGVPEGEISKEYELTYFAPAGWSMWTLKDPDHYYHTRDREENFAATCDYLWEKGGQGSFADRVTKYLIQSGVKEKDIDDLRRIMLTDK